MLISLVTDALKFLAWAINAHLLIRTRSLDNPKWLTLALGKISRTLSGDSSALTFLGVLLNFLSSALATSDPTVDTQPFLTVVPLRFLCRHLKPCPPFNYYNRVWTWIWIWI